MSPTDGEVTRKAAAALNRLVLERIVVSYAVAFERRRLVITVRIEAQDDLSAARAKRRVQEAIDPVSPGATVVIKVGPPGVMGRT